MDANSNKVYNVNPQIANADNTEEITVVFSVNNANVSGYIEFDFTLKLDNQQTVNNNFTVSGAGTTSTRIGNTYITESTLTSNTQLTVSTAGADNFYDYYPTVDNTNKKVYTAYHVFGNEEATVNANVETFKSTHFAVSGGNITRFLSVKLPT